MTVSDNLTSELIISTRCCEGITAAHRAQCIDDSQPPIHSATHLQRPAASNTRSAVLMPRVSIPRPGPSLGRLGSMRFIAERTLNFYRFAYVGIKIVVDANAERKA